MELIEIVDNRFSLQEEDPADQFFGMLHFIDRTFLDGFVQMLCKVTNIFWRNPGGNIV